MMGMVPEGSASQGTGDRIGFSKKKKSLRSQTESPLITLEEVPRALKGPLRAQSGAAEGWAGETLAGRG